jgi:hypothetical protein
MLGRVLKEAWRNLFQNKGGQEPLGPGITRMSEGSNSLDTLLRAPLSFPKHFNYESVAWFQAAMQSADYMASHMMAARDLVTPAALLEFALEQCAIEGLVLEFGVYRGASLATIARWSQQTVHGFDSFEGLPEDWTYYQKKGRFGLDGVLPELNANNVELHKGWFDETLPMFLANQVGPIRFLHIDCDLYSSASYVLKTLGERLRAGSIILFDEYLNYPGWQLHEFKAFREFVEKTEMQYEYIGFASSASSVAVRVSGQREAEYRYVPR